MICRRVAGKLFHRRGPATVKLLSPRGIRNNSKYVEFVWRVVTVFKYGRVETCINFKRFNIEAYHLRQKCCPWIALSKNVWYGAIAPKGHHQVPNMSRFGATLFVHSNSPPLYTLPLPSPLSCPTCPLSHFIPPLPFSKEVNKKLSYRGQNALSIIKHTNAIPSANMYCFYWQETSTLRQWPSNRICSGKSDAN